ncbi:mechanosensitive ion channel family protein [Flavitalea flava]
MRTFLFLSLCLFGAGFVTAQDTIRSDRRKFDSSLFSESNTLTRSDYLENLEKVFQLLNQVPATTASFIQLKDIHEQLDQEDSALAILKERMSQNDRTFNIRNLQMFNTLLDELEDKTGDYTDFLDSYDSTMDEVKRGIAGLKKDTLLFKIFKDSSLRTSFQPQMLQLKTKWKLVDSLVRTNAREINNLQARASANAITIRELLYQVDTELETVGNRAFGKERRYLWEPRSSATANYSRDNFKKSFDSEQKLVQYYFSNTRGKRSWLLLTGVVFFYWVWSNFRRLKRLDNLHAIDDFHFRYIHPRPVVVSLIFLLSLAPLFDLHAPAIYIESTQFLLIVLLTILFWKRLARNQFYGWCLFILLFLLVPVTRILGLPMSWQRWGNVLQNGLSAAFGLFFLFKWRNRQRMQDKSTDKAAERTTEWPRIVLFSAGLYVFLNALAVLCNLTGRVTLSQIFGTSAVYAFAQTVSLTVFVRLIVEAFLLQIQTSRVRKKYPEQFDFAGISRSISRFVNALAILLWLIVFTTNLNLFDSINDMILELFSAPRDLGSFSFTLGGVALFLGIIWIANFLQKYIAYFFGDTGDDAAIDDKGQRSRLLITRLILLVAGFLLAVAASGLPIDKITVILGALGVGIGLGLQSIVNNFVSGIILIFDRPLRIGDTVEIGDKKGRVKEISIRSSTLLTEEGAEVIIPNGDVLSHNIVNWTLSNRHVRVGLSFTIEKPANPDTIQMEDLKKIIMDNPNVLERREPEIFMNNISSKTIEIKIYFWCKDIGKTSLTSGEVRSEIYRHLEKNGMNLL